MVNCPKCHAEPGGNGRLVHTPSCIIGRVIAGCPSPRDVYAMEWGGQRYTPADLLDPAPNREDAA